METEEAKTNETNQESHFRVVLPYRRTWYYKFKLYIKKVLFKQEIKALPAPK